jgi:hypothetical protein
VGGPLVRSSSDDRLFPVPDVDFYTPASPSSSPSAGQQILNLARAPLGSWARWTGIGLKPVDQVARLLRLHRLAFEAERNGRERRADFFWREALRGLRRLSKRPKVWQALWEAHGKAVTSDAEALQKRIALEVFADLHAAFANAKLDQAEAPAPIDLAYRHLHYLREVLPLTGMTTDDQAALLAPAMLAEIDALEKAKRGSAAVAVARDLLALAPGKPEFQKRLALAHFDAAVKSLSDRPAGKERAEAAALRQGIEQLEEVRRQFPYHTLIYQLIGLLQNLRAVRLTNGSDLPEGLVAARKAIVFHPPLEAEPGLFAQLVNHMRDLQTRMAEVEQQIRRSSNTTLTADGQKALAQSRKGFAPLEAYLKTDEPAQIAAAREKAQAREIWLEIGLPPEEGDWDGRAVALVTSAGAIFGTEPSTIEAFTAAFEREQTARPILAGIDVAAVAAFVKRRRDNVPAPATGATAPVPVAAKIAVLDPTARARGRDREPLGYWLFGHQDYGARLAVAAAAVAALALAGAAGFDAFGSSIRADAYAAMVAAAPRDDDATVVREAERFMAAETLRQSDLREAHVHALLAQAQEAPNRRVRDAAARETQAALDGDDGRAVLRAVEKFAGAPPLHQQDPRAAGMRDIYARTFVRWFAGLDGAAEAEAAAQAQAYRAVSAQLARMAGDAK